jgi:hypothetical protein
MSYSPCAETPAFRGIRMLIITFTKAFYVFLRYTRPAYLFVQDLIM